MIRMAKKSCKAWWAWLVAIAALVLVAFLNFSPIYILLVVMIIGFSLTYYKEKRA